MIMPICVRPYPGELLYGWIVRLARLNGYQSVEKFCERYFYQSTPKYETAKKTVRLDYRFNLDNICKEYDNIQCFPDVVTILKNMTPYFAYAPFWPYNYQVKKSQMILREQRDSVLNINGMSSDIQELYICPECMREDTANYGEPYLHTEHHLHKVSICAKHQVPLQMASSELISYNETGKYIKVVSPYSENIQIKIAEFISGLFHDPPLASLAETKMAIFVKMKEKGYPLSAPYGKMLEDMEAEGYMKGKEISRPRFKNVLGGSKIALDILLPLTIFLFDDYVDFKKTIEKYAERPFYTAPKNYSDYELLESSNGFLKLECRSCGNRFYIHPYALEMGHVCPECEKRNGDEENIRRMLRKLGDGEYELIGSAAKRKVRVYHKTCGHERLSDIQYVIYDECECQCAYLTTTATVQKLIGKEFKVLSIIRERNFSRVVLQHTKCGYVFSISLNAFLKRPFCRNCDENHVPELVFRKRMQDLTGDEYELVSKYKSSNDMVKIRHKRCGTVSEMKAENFLYGSRCTLCTRSVYKEQFQDILDQYAGENYHVVDIKGHKIAVQGPDGIVYEHKAPFFIQELSRPTPSDIFKDRQNILVPAITARAEMYLEAKKCCERYQVWIPDFEPGTEGYAMRKSLAKRLVKEGYLFRQVEGVYSIQEFIPDEVIVNQKYIERAGEKIGVYYGKSLAYRCGIIDDKPDKEYILCNNGSSSFVTGKVRDTEVRVKKTYIPITGQNYYLIEALNLLMFLVIYPSCQKKVEDYLMKKGIFLDKLEPLAREYPESINKIIMKLFK